jgi:hypothetical protein
MFILFTLSNYSAPFLYFSTFLLYDLFCQSFVGVYKRWTVYLLHDLVQNQDEVYPFVEVELILQHEGCATHSLHPVF